MTLFREQAIVSKWIDMYELNVTETAMSSRSVSHWFRAEAHSEIACGSGRILHLWLGHNVTD